MLLGYFKITEMDIHFPLWGTFFDKNLIIYRVYRVWFTGYGYISAAAVYTYYAYCKL